MIPPSHAQRPETGRTEPPAQRRPVVGPLARTYAFAVVGSRYVVLLGWLAAAMALGVLIDAFVVRSLMVPAMVALFGRANWWLPTRLARVLRVAPSAAVTVPLASMS